MINTKHRPCHLQTHCLIKQWIKMEQKIIHDDSRTKFYHF